jgi:hypothetical protein
MKEAKKINFKYQHTVVSSPRFLSSSFNSATVFLLQADILRSLENVMALVFYKVGESGAKRKRKNLLFSIFSPRIFLTGHAQ